MDHRRSKRGVLEQLAAGYEAFLVSRGMAPISVGRRMSQWAVLGSWLATQGLTASGLADQVAERFRDARRACGRATWVSGHSLALPMAYLRSVGASPEAFDAGEAPTGGLAASYGRYLRDERGLAVETRRAYLRIAGVFSRSLPSGWDGLADVAGSDVSRFVVTSCRGGSAASTKKTVTALASLLRYLFAAGVTAEPLWWALPKAAGRRSAKHVPALASNDVVRLLDGCDLATVAGARDRAVMTVLARLGLRAGELAALTLDDIDWLLGKFAVHVKGSRLESVPLPGDVGRVVTAYLRVRQPAPAGCRSVFLTLVPPVGPVTVGTVSQLVRRAARRAGLSPFGSHRLRHFAATTTLRAGASISEVAELLRHRSLQVTSRYALVDPAALRELATPWPGGAS